MNVFINDNKVQMISDMSEEECEKIRHLYQVVYPIEHFPREPKVGWIHDAKGGCHPNIKEVTPRQIRQAWILMGKSLTEIEIAIDSLPEPQRSLARAEWEYSTVVFRRNPLVTLLAYLNGYSDDELDALWLFAGSL